MSLIVQKFGGTSVRDADRLKNVAKIITESYKQGNDIVAVVSAQGKFTDELIAKGLEVNPKPSKREMDMLVSAGEQISASLLALTIENMGFKVKSLLGWQIGMSTDSSYTSAKIKKILPKRIESEISNRNIVIVAGFQGINRKEDITTLGRGGSDTTAVAIAAALHADKCEIYTDVDGIYTTDPRICKNAQKLDEITYDEMLELASLGAQVLHNRSVEMAKKYSVNLEVKSSLENLPGTKVVEAIKMEKMLVRGVAKDENVARISLIGVKDSPGIAFKIFSKLAMAKVNVDIILQCVGRDGTKDITFTVPKDQGEDARAALEPILPTLGGAKLTCDENVAKISVVGAGMETHHGVASTMFEALHEENVNIQMISTSEIKISVLIDIADAERALKAVHNAFID